MASSFHNSKTGPSTSAAVPEHNLKPALGRPHDAYATFGVALALASLMFFSGRVRIEADWIGWTGFAVSLVTVLATVRYLQRAFGFRSQGFDNLPRGALACTMMAAIFGIQFVPAALYAQYFEENLFGFTLICLALAVMVVGPFRLALGEAPQPDQDAPSES